METTDDLLKAILATVARTAFPPEVLIKIVAPTSGSEKQLLAYNLGDGKTSDRDVSRKSKLDKGNFSRTVTRWIQEGVVVRLGPDRLPLHLYPLIETSKGVKQKS